MKKTIIILIISIICLTACSSENQNENVIPTDDRDKSITTFGVIKCLNSKSIVAPFNTSIKRVLTGEGEEVVKGQPLIEINLSESNLQIDKLLNEIDSLKQRLEDLEIKLKTLQDQAFLKTNNINQNIISLNKKLSVSNSYIKTGLSPETRKLTLALETAENDLLLEKSNLTDFKILYAAGGLSLKDYEQQQGNVKAKEKRIKEIQLEIDALKEKYQSDADSLEISINQKKSELTDLQADMSNEVRELKASIEQSKKLLFSAEAELKNLTDSIDKTSIRNDLLVCDVNRAAIDSIRFNPGDTIDAGSIIAILMDLDSLYVENKVFYRYIWILMYKSFRKWIRLNFIQEKLHLSQL